MDSAPTKTERKNDTESDEKDPSLRVVDRRWWARGDSGSVSDSQASSLKPTYVEDLEKRLADVTEQLQAALADHRRAADEFEQVKVRLRRDTGREVERGKRDVLREMLDVVDNLDRAIAVGGPESGDGSAEALSRGIGLVRDQFLAKLAGFGVERMAALGTPFDATRHEALSLAPVEHADQDGHVIAIAKEGYAIGDEVLRPASVVVGRTQ